MCTLHSPLFRRLCSFVISSVFFLLLLNFRSFAGDFLRRLCVQFFAHESDQHKISVKFPSIVSTVHQISYFFEKKNYRTIASVLIIVRKKKQKKKMHLRNAEIENDFEWICSELMLIVWTSITNGH